LNRSYEVRVDKRSELGDKIKGCVILNIGLPAIMRIISLHSLRCAAISLMACHPFVTEAAALDSSKLPPPATQQVDFDRDIKPIFQKSCIFCHSQKVAKGMFRLTDRASVLKGGTNGVVVIPGQSANSRLIHLVSGLDPELVMPPVKQGARLSSDQVAVLRAWIDQGLTWGEPQTKPK
jgi:hypothetical protein